MKRSIYIMLSVVMLAGLSLVAGCRNYDDPAPEKIWTRADFEAQGRGDKFMTIEDFKNTYYYSIHGNTINQNTRINDDVIIEGRVISNDESGNVYRSFYIQDATGVLEIKNGKSANYQKYKPGQTVFIEAKGLVLGDYRYMLSLGFESTDAAYSNTWIDAALANEEHIKRGASGQPTSQDTIVIHSLAELQTRMSTIDGERSMLGRLVRLEGLKSVHGVFDGDTYPNFLYSVDKTYATYTFADAISTWETYELELSKHQNNPSYPKPTKPVYNKPGNMTAATYAYKSDPNSEGAMQSFYGSALLRYDGNTTDKMANLILRSSGYAKFALQPIPADGKDVTVTAIFAKYSASSGNYVKYQLTLNDIKDLVVR